MKIDWKPVTQITITGAQDLDPVRVILEDFGVGQGRLTVGVFGEAWEHYWPAMGDCYTVRTFILKADTHYIAEKLCRGDVRETDFDAVSEAVGKMVSNYYELGFLDHSLLVAAYGHDWALDLPRRYTREYEDLLQIVEVIKDAIAREVADHA